MSKTKDLMPPTSIEKIVTIFNQADTLAVPLATGQPGALLNSLSTRDNWENLQIFCGLLTFPYPILSHPNVSILSGFYGPIERYLNEAGAKMTYLPANFQGFEIFARKTKPRVVATTLSPPDADGFVTFGTHCGAIYNSFVEAANDPNRITIGEINPQMPQVFGHADYGDNKIHLSKISHWFEADQTPLPPPEYELTDVEQRIAENVVSLIESGDTLQLGIGPVPDHVANLLAKSNKNEFGIHSEMIADGFLRLFDAGKISNNHKSIFQNQSVFTFAFGSQALYDFLDERKGKNRRQAITLPVSVVNDPHMISKNKNMISINSALMVDFNGQICSEAIGLKQYSGVGGQLSFVEGAYQAENGKSIICLKSTVTIEGKLVSNIRSVLPSGSIVSTPRHFAQYIVTEYGIANLYGVPDEKRAEKLIPLAHPSFRDQLKAEFLEIKEKFYKN